MTAEENKKTAELVKDLCKLERGLSDWEVNFVEDMSHQATFSTKQTGKIWELWIKFFG